MNASDFGDDFIWGVATSAYQIEGAHNLDGKGPNIWDDFTTKKRKIKGGHHAKEACNFYHHYQNDILLIKSMGIKNFRFSISWSRILPEGIGKVNHKGLNFYNRVIDCCLEHDIEPWVTLYHWDLPLALEQKGGWTNRDIIAWFTEYVSLCIRSFGDRVKRWMVLNEPLAFTGVGYFLGIHAPGKRGMKNFIPAVHYAALCQAEGGRVIKHFQPSAEVGTTFSLSQITPQKPDREADIRAAARVDALLNRLFLEPSLGLGYPLKELKFLERIERYIRNGDTESLAFDFDFVGLQTYTREVVKYTPFVPYMRARALKPNKKSSLITEMNWEVFPPSIYHMLKKLSVYGVKSIYITENGAAFNDLVQNNQVIDPLRVNYLRDHIEQVLRAKKEGIQINGYFVWSLLDNFEWSYGYHPRFGIVHVDYKTQKRIIKSSGHWYASFIEK